MFKGIEMTISHERFESDNKYFHIRTVHSRLPIYQSKNFSKKCLRGEPYDF